MGVLMILGIVVLVGALFGFFLFPTLSYVIGPGFSMPGIANLQILFAQLAAGNGLLIPERDGSYTWAVADDDGNELVFDYEGETYRKEGKERMERVGWRPLGIASVAYDRWVDPLRPESLEARGELSPEAKPSVVENGTRVELTVADTRETDDGEEVQLEAATDGGLPAKIPLAETDQNEQLWVPRDVWEAFQDGDRDVIDLRKYIRPMGPLGDSEGVEHAEREGKQDAGPTELGPFAIMLGVLLMGAMGVLTGLVGTGAI
jgi:hypothetical protein